MLKKATLFDNLKGLDVHEGDVLFVRASVKELGRIEGSYSDFLNWILEYLGPSGTICALSFTPYDKISKLDRTVAFDSKTKSNAGGFSNLVLRHRNAVRSQHPTNSFVAIGKHAEDIVWGHDAASSCYYPMDKIIKLKGKMILMGCSESSPGFTTVHWAQHKLGYSTQSFYKNRYGAMYDNQGVRELYIKTDFGGCSNGFGNFYIEYLNKKIMRTGFVGGAFCIAARADQAFNIEMEILKIDPTFCFCRSSLCADCRLSWKFNKRDIVQYFGAAIANTLVALVRREK